MDIKSTPVEIANGLLDEVVEEVRNRLLVEGGFKDDDVLERALVDEARAFEIAHETENDSQKSYDAAKRIAALAIIYMANGH